MGEKGGIGARTYLRARVKKKKKFGFLKKQGGAN